MNPRIDVIIPCYDYGRYLRRCVESVLAPGGPPARVLILDDCSTDDTPEIGAALAAGDPRIHFRRHAVNRGHIATYNEGLEWAAAEYLLLLSADDWVLPGALDRAVACLDAEPAAGFVHGPAVEVHEGRPPPPELDAPPALGWRLQDTGTFLRANAYANQVATCTAVVRTALQKSLGGYREELPHAGDLEMWLRLALHAPVARLNAIQGVYFQHARNMSADWYRRMIADFRQRLLALEILSSQHGALLRPDDAATLRRGLAESAMHFANQPFGIGDVAQFDEMRAFAAEVDPTILRTAHWWIQALKRAVGPRAWAALRPSAHPGALPGAVPPGC